jgi:hypothetical protein
MLPIRHAGHPPYGRFNSLCHRLSLITFDDQIPNLAGYTGQVALKGYDNMTGIGTPAASRSSGPCAGWKAD